MRDATLWYKKTLTGNLVLMITYSSDGIKTTRPLREPELIEIIRIVSEQVDKG